ncbi:MAG: hypothetical protein ABW250_02475 [Pyrinomonadaceae bacterium]
MSKSTREAIIDVYSKREARLLEEFAALNDQLDMSGDVTEKIRLKRAIVAKETELKEVADKIARERIAVPGTRARHAAVEEHLPMIDFQEAVEVVEGRFGIGGIEGAAGVFIMQNGRPMGGEWCIARIKSRLAMETHEVKYYPVGFSSGGQLDEWGFLHQLASYVNLGGEYDDITAYARDVTRKIADGLPPGCIAFIEVSHWDYVHPQERVLSWLINDFWVPFVRELPNIHRERRRVRLVLMIVAESSLPPALLDLPVCCKGPADFHSERVIELALRNWTREEIKAWLEKYTDLEARRIDRTLEVVYNSSHCGVPGLVRDALHDHLS